MAANLNTDHLLRCLQTLEAALELYQQAVPGGIEHEVFRNAVVKGYELAQETSHKLLRRALLEFDYGARRLDETPAREILRLAATHGLLSLEEVERWFAYRTNRNNIDHECGVDLAQETLDSLPGFIADCRRLEGGLRESMRNFEELDRHDWRCFDITSSKSMLFSSPRR